VDFRADFELGETLELIMSGQSRGDLKFARVCRIRNAGVYLLSLFSLLFLLLFFNAFLKIFYAIKNHSAP
jgi:hypothetical protein